MKKTIFTILCLVGMTMNNSYVSAQRIQQPLGRGVVVAVNGSSATVTWRRLAQEPENATYNIYVNGNKITPAPVANTNYATNTSKVPIGSEIAVSVVTDGVESPLSTPYKVENRDLRNMYMKISFSGSPLTASGYTTDYVWPADLDGDGEMDYVVNRKSLSTGLDNYVEGYLRTGEHLWTVKLGPNELSCAGQDDMILAYDMDCDGKADVVCQTSDGTQFWNAENKTFGLYVNGLTTGDTDGDGIINYETQSSRNAPRYMTVVDGMTGAEKCSVEQTYNNSYNRTNRAALMGDEYNKHVGHVGVFYPDGIHPAMIMEWHTRNSNGSHNYHNSAFAFDFSTGKAGEWKELFCKNTGGPAFHQIRIADVDGDGRDEMQTGGYTMDHDGSTINSPGIAHGDRFRTSDIDPERPGLETFAIQQDAGDMLGQILYDAATGKSIKRWYLSAVGDVGRGECMDVDPNHLGWEMWSTMGGVYNAKGDLIPEHTAPYPTEGIWWDGALDREIVQTSDSHYNVYIQDFYKGRLIEIAKLSNWRYVTVYAKRAAFWGDIIGDWREELVLLHKENGVCVGIVGFTTDYTTTVDNIYCLQEDPHYRGDCTTKGYYQSPNTGFYLGYDMPRPQLPPTMVTDLVWQGTDSYSNYERSATAAYADGKSLLIDLNTDASVSVNAAMQPSVLYAMPTKGQRVALSGAGSLIGDMDLWKSQQGTLVADIPLDYTGTTYISEGTLEVNDRISSPISLRARGTLAGVGSINGGISFENALNYEGTRLSPGNSDNKYGTLTINGNLNIDQHVYYEVNLKTAGNAINDHLMINGDFTTGSTLHLRFIIEEDKPAPGIYTLITWTGEYSGNTTSIQVSGLKGLYYEIRQENNNLVLEIKRQRNPANQVIWKGSESNYWDYQTLNFNLDNEPTGFVSGDTVLFNDEAESTTVILNELTPTGGVTFDIETKDITINGEGGLSGKGGLVKNGNGHLILNTRKSDYTGSTIINEGIVTVTELADGNIPSSLGASPATTGNLQLGKATLLVNNNNTSTNRNVTLLDTATIQIASGTTSLKGVINGEGTLVKTGNGQLNITYAGSNTWTGGTILKAGILAMGAWNTTFGKLGSKMHVQGSSTIKIFDVNSISTIPNFDYAVTIDKGCHLSLNLGMRCQVGGSFSGEGTLALSFPSVRGDIRANMANFHGTLTATGNQFRLRQATNLQHATVTLLNDVYLAHFSSDKEEANYTTSMGALTSTSTTCSIGMGTYNVGYLDIDFSYAGILGSNAVLNKYGNGTMTLTGNSNACPITVHEGAVEVTNTAKAYTTGLTTVKAGGMIYGEGITSYLTIEKGGILASSMSARPNTCLTINGNLTVKRDAIVRVRVRKSSAKTYVGGYKVTGTARFTAPVFELTLTNDAEWMAGDSISVIQNNNSRITLTDSPTFIPEVPGEGLEWDYSTFTIDGAIRVKSASEIKSLATDVDETPYYDLQGHPTENPQYGIYIRNGRKILIKPAVIQYPQQ